MLPSSCRTIMTKEELFEIWAPPNGRWSPWVKPVLFASMDREPALGAEASMDFNTSGIPSVQNNAALVLDLPGAEGIWTGVALAAQGYRSVPLYNAVPGPTTPVFASIATTGASALVDVTQILAALWHGAGRLQEMNLLPNSPPAFLLDANRRGEGLTPVSGRFD